MASHVTGPSVLLKLLEILLLKLIKQIDQVNTIEYNSSKTIALEAFILYYFDWLKQIKKNFSMLDIKIDKSKDTAIGYISSLQYFLSWTPFDPRRPRGIT